MSKFSQLCTDIVDFGSAKSNPRTEQITKITIHHMAGVSSGKDCASDHLHDAVDHSANYYIGNAGDICGGVSEDRRAWTSGSPWNDQKAITIEVSNSDAKEPWPVSDAAYAATIRLCADICNRYGIIPKFTNTKDGSLTLHCMFQATECPGTAWRKLFAKGQVVSDIVAAIPRVISDEEKIWNFLYDKIGNEYGVAGLMGNLFAESGLRPNNLQNSFETKLGMTDAQYTAAVDNGSYSKENFKKDGAGYGMAQWTFWTRKQGMYEYLIEQQHVSISDFYGQLNYLWIELSTKYKGLLPDLKNATNVYDASTAVLTKFERPADQSDKMKQTRASYSQKYYDKYAKGGGGQPSPTPKLPYAVRIMVDDLNIRSGPGTTFVIVGQVHRGSAFTIVEETNGWGKLKSGAGWISLNYTQRV